MKNIIALLAISIFTAGIAQDTKEQKEPVKKEAKTCCSAKQEKKVKSKKDCCKEKKSCTKK